MKITSIAKRTARLSLLIGTSLFLIAKLTSFQPIWIVGLAYIVVAFFVNGLILFTLFIHLITSSSPHHRSALLRSAALLLFNIPVAILYAWILLDLTNSNL